MLRFLDVHLLIFGRLPYLCWDHQIRRHWVNPMEACNCRCKSTQVVGLIRYADIGLTAWMLATIAANVDRSIGIKGSCLW